MSKSNKNFKFGDTVYVVLRNLDLEPDGVEGFMYLANVEDAVIVCPIFYKCDKFDALKYIIKNSREDYCTDVYIFYEKDAYQYLADAEQAYNDELGI